MMRHDCLHYFPILFILFLCSPPQRILGSRLSFSKSVNGYNYINNVPFSFPLSSYTASILPDIGPNNYILTNEPRFGVPEPFNGRPSGTVSFAILGNLEYRESFSTETFKQGGFYFLRLRTTHNADFNSKKQSVYSFDIQAVFQSEQISNRPPITLTNKTQITISLIDRNDNCPFFSQDIFQLTVFENATLFTKIGTVHATDADRGIDGQIYYFLQPERVLVPFRIDTRSGDIFPTKSLLIKRGGSTSVEQVTYFSKFEGLEDYSFKVIARHRGNLSHVSCEFVSHAQVHVKVKPIRSDGPQISSFLHTDIEKPGSPGSVYATISVTSFGNPLNTHLSIIEPEAAALFELVRMGQQSIWQLQLKFQYPALSLSSKVGLTLEAVDTRIATVGHIPSTSQHFFEVTLLPQLAFQIRLPQEIYLSVSEVALVNSTVYIINPNLSFYIHNSSFLFSETKKRDNVPFRITETGAVVVTKPIDLETLGTDRVEIFFTVVDRNNILLSSMADSKLLINILDYNEHSPEILNDGAECSIPENLPVGSEVLQIEARDPDFSATSLIFSLFDEDKLPFNFSTNKPGSMLLKTPLDAETMPTEFHVKVKVSDSGLPFPRSMIVIYLIRIIDINEFSPVFVEKSCEAQLVVTPNGQIQTLAPSGLELGRFFAEDLDRDGGSAVKIRLASTTVSRPCFKLDSDTGRLQLICSNIGLPETSITVNLEATDGELNSERPFELKINLEKAGYGRVYSKSCQPSGIYGKIQEQKQKRSDYEYRLADITSIDTFFKRNDEVITPSLSVPTVLRIPENLPIGTPILTFSAKFLESFKGGQFPQLVYGIVGLQTFLTNNDSTFPPYQAFRLGGDSTSDVSVDDEMVLEVAAPIDREIFSAFLISLQVCVLQDSARPCASSSVSILIEDILDAPPRFVIDDSQAGTHSFYVSEDEAEGSIIGQVAVVDDDIESKLRFSLGNYKEFFKIHHRTGRISLKQRLDRETLDSYLVSVKVVDVLDDPKLNSPPELNALALKFTPDWALERTATTYVRVNVLDANDNNPEFIGTYNDIVIPSDFPKGAYVTTLRAKDADDSHNALLQYSLFGSEADKTCFDCDLATGVVRIAAECKGLQPGYTHSLTAWVRDLGSPESRQTSIEFKVTILGLRVNVHPPRFNNLNGLYQGRLREGAPIGSRVLEIANENPLLMRASDPEGLLLIFRTVGGSGLGTFTVTSEGFIISTREVDAESTPFSGGYWLEVYAEEDQSSNETVTATDGIPPRFAVAEIFIQIEDENDNRPVPEAPEYRFHVTENTPGQTIVATVTARDRDATGNQISYAIVSGDPDGYFIINPSTGQIATSERPIDRETSFMSTQGLPTDEVHLVIHLTDSGEPSKTTVVHATAVIDDVNDNTPQFLFTRTECGSQTEEGEECYHFVHRPSPHGSNSSCLGRVFAVDLDRGANGSVAYEMAQPDPFFSVDPVSGQVCPTGVSLTVPSENLIWVTASDHGSPPRFTAQPIAIHISVLNRISDLDLSTDKQIRFLSSPPNKLTISPQTPPGTVLYNLEVVPDASLNTNWTFRFADNLESTPFGIATLSAIKAVVYLQQWLNADSEYSYELKVAISLGRLSTTRRTKIVIEASERQPPVIQTSNIVAGKQVKMNVTDFRQETEESGASGVLVNLGVPESTLVGSLVCSLAKTHGSPSPFVFSIVAAEKNSSLFYFHLSKETGELTITQPLDFETQQEHRLLVGLFHRNELDSRGSYFSLVINVIDVNEFVPFFQPLSSIMVSADTPVGNTVGRISAYDPDFNGESESGITYTITSVGDAEFFKIDKETGALRIAKPLWNSKTNASSLTLWPPRYNLRVTATDRDNGVNHTMVTITLSPGPGAVSRPLPRFRQSIFIAKIVENAPAGCIIAPLKDFLETSPLVPVVFKLLNHNDDFAISANSGFLASLTSFDREVQDIYRLKVQVSGLDGLPSKLPHTAEIEVHVLDVNDNNPQINTLWINGILKSKAPPNSPVIDEKTGKPLTLCSFDPDLGPAGEVMYTFVGPFAELYSEKFSIDQRTGVLYQRSNVSMPPQNAILLNVEISDRAVPLVRTADTLVRIRVRFDKARNEGPPRFSPANPLVLNVFLPTYEGVEVARFTAIDPDFNDTVTYHIGEGDPSDFFLIDQSTGILRISHQLASLSTISQRQFYLRIEAKDSDGMHTAVHNVTVFIHTPDTSKRRLVIEPSGGLNVSLIEHFANKGIPKFLGQLNVRNALPNEVFSFELANTSTGCFSINRHTGAFYATGDPVAAEDLDREITPVVRLRVIVKDLVSTSLGMSQQRFGESWINVHLEDINDNDPKFIGLPYHTTFCVKGHTLASDPSKLNGLTTPANHVLAQLQEVCQSNFFKVEAKDEDSGRNGELSYQIISTQPHAEPPLLSIDPISGRLSLIRAVPSDWAGRRLTARIRATDGGQRYADTQVWVQLAARLGPRFTSTHYAAVVSEDASIGESVASVIAISASGTTLLYRIVSIGPDHSESSVGKSPFYLEYETGIIRVGSPLDYEKMNYYNLVVETLDTTTGNTARVNVHINVTDVNDERPVFAAPLYKAVISEDAEIGSVISLHPPQLAEDADSGVNGQIRYYLQSLNDEETRIGQNTLVPGLEIDAVNGTLRISEMIDYEKQPSLTFWIVAVDLGSPPLIGRSLVELTILDANDNPPLFDPETSGKQAFENTCHREATVAVDAPTDSFVLRLTASDPDVNDSLTYRLLPVSNDADLFRINSTSGVVHWRPPLASGSSDRLASALLAYESGGAARLSFEVEVSDGLHTLTCWVEVSVVPSNRYSPRFSVPVQSIQIPEDAQVGSRVALLTTAEDDDVGVFSRLSYFLLDKSKELPFSLDSETGELTLSSPVDRETEEFYLLTVIASDAGGLSDFMKLNITVTDVNDNAPIIEQTEYEITLPPSEYTDDTWVTFASSSRIQPGGLRLPLIIKAHDKDSGSNANIIYRLLPGSLHVSSSDVLPFTIDAQSGVVLLTHPLKPSTQEYSFLVEACDQPVEDRSLCSEPADVSIHLITEDLSLNINIACNAVPIPELGHSLNDPVAGCQIKSVPDLKQTGVWSLVGSTSSMNIFKIDPKLGSIFAINDLDYESQSSHELIVQYRIPSVSENSLTVPLMEVSHVTIKVEDVNDCTPIFQSDSKARISIPENLSSGRRIYRLQAKDCDAVDEGLLSYSIRRKPGIASDLSLLPFSIDSDGWITVTGLVDRETTESFELVITVTDTAHHTAVSYLTIEVYDLNDNAPEWNLTNISNFDSPSTEVHVTENSLPSSPIFRFSAVDKDISSNPALMKFYQVGEPLQEFVVSPDGSVYVRKKLDAESKQCYELKVNAFDGLHESTRSFTLRIRVDDLNDNSPICHIPNRETEVLESAKNGTILFHLNATDADVLKAHSEIFYSLLDVKNDAKAFAIDQKTGEVLLIWDLDYELKKEYSFRVEAKDSANHACLYDLKVRVLDVNDNAPIFDEPIKLSSVPENALVGSLVGKVHATDADSVDTNGLEYSILSPRNASFSVERHSGLLRVVQPLDRETLALHRFVVLVTDGAAKGGGVSGPVHSATASVEIQLADVNDSPPQFVEPRPTADISEASPVGTLIMKLTAISLDEGDNAVVRYRLLETDKPEFALNSTTGELYLTNSLDYERTPRYFLTIEAKDGGTPPLSTTTVVTINVVDENDNSPYFIGQDVPAIGNFSESNSSEAHEIGVFSFEVYENSPVGTQIGRVTARDPDLGENGRLSFSICESMQPAGEVINVGFSTRSSSTSAVGRLFEVGESRGEISLLFSPDREVATLYEFMVCVVDHGEPPRSAVTRVQVTIRDTNDCQPQFERSNYEFYVQVDRNGNVVSTDQFGSLGNVSQTEDAEILLGHLALRDMDASPNTGPFKCKLAGFVGSSVGSWDTSTPLFIVKPVSASLDDFSVDSGVIPTPADITFFQNLEANQTGFCSLYAASKLPLGSKNLVIRAHDSGMTALHSSVTVTVHISRQSNLPPEIINSNTTLVIFRDTSGSTAPSLKHRFDLDNSISATKVQKAQDSPLMRVTVRDRTAYDHLFFELLPNPFASHFIIDQYDGSIYVKSFTSRPMESAVSGTMEKDPSLEWLEPSLPQLPAIAQLNSGEYKLRVRVANGSLSSNGTLHLKVITVTEEMLEAACVLHVADISPNELFLLHLNEVILQELAEGLFKQSTPQGRAQAKDNIFLISVQSGSSIMHRQKRSVGGGSDMLIAVYAPREKRFIESNQLVQRIHALQANLSKSVGHQMHAYNSLCAQKRCESGSCVTRIELSPQSEIVEVHGSNQISPRFSLVAKCRCSTNFGGADCERPRDVCATTTCAAPRICVPSQNSPLSQHACVCPLPWTGPNCDRLSRLSASSSQSFSGSDACFSDACFLQRERGPLQFTGGSFAHWQVGNPNEYKIEIAFSIRTRQKSGPLFAVNWNSLRAFRIHLVNNSNLAVSPIDFTTGKPINDWIVSSRTQLGDGQWHRVRFVLFATATDWNDLQWWVELAIDGAQTYSKLIDWLPGDPERQDVLFGAELVHGFRPLAEAFYPDSWMKNDQSGPVDVDWPHFDFAAPPAVLRFGFVGCIKDVLIDRVKPPYQLGLSTQQAVLSAMQNRKATVGTSADEDRGIGGLPVIQVIRTHKLEYQCSSQKTYEGSCAYAPCLNGGTCTSRRVLAFAQIDRGPGAVRPSDFNCTCQTGFQGSLCEETTDICRLQPCLNGGNCEPVSGKPSAYQCICPQGFKGVHCEKAANNSNIACIKAEAVLIAVSEEKSVSLCNHGAACLDTPEGPACICPSGWRGGRCEYDIDECHLATTAYAAASAAATESDRGHYRYLDFSGPLNDPLCNTYGSRRGICINLPGSYQCNCSLGYAGRNCQIRNLTPLKPDSNALGLTPMHGYIIAGIFAIVFLVAVITVVILTCCFRRRSSMTNQFYTTRNDGQSNSSFFPGCDKMLVAGLLQPQQQQQVKLLSDSGTRMLPDGGDGSVTYSPTRTLGGSMILAPGRPLLTPDVKRQSSYFMDENGRLMLMRPNSVVGSNGGPGEPLKMVYLGGGTSGAMSTVPVGYMPATATLARRSFIDCSMQHRVAPMTPQHLSQVHLAPHSNHMVHLQHPVSSSVHQQPRPGSSNTMTSDRISLGSGSDQFSVQSGGPRGVQGQTVMMSPQSQHQQTPSSTQQQVFYVYPQSTASTQPSQIILPHQMLPSEAPPLMFYRPDSVGNLSASGRLPLRDQRLSMIGTHKAGRVINCQSQLIPLQVIPNGPTIRPATSLNFVQNIRPRAISPPTVQSHPYWAESTLSLLPPLPPSALANQLNAINQNPRTSLYRKAASSNADLRRPNRLVKQRNSLVIDGEPLIRDLRATQRPQSVCTPLLLTNGSGEACSNPAEDLENTVHWDNQAGSTPSSAFVIAEPRGLQKVPLMRQTPVLSASRQESLNGSGNTLAAPILAADSQQHQPSADGTLKPSPRIKGDREEPASNGVKTNGLTPRPMPPNVIVGNGNDASKNDQRKSATNTTYPLKPLLDNSDDGHAGTLKKQNQ